MRIALSLLLALACACASSSSHSVVKPEALPDRHRAVLSAWQKGGTAWELERDHVRADPELARFVVDNLLIEMVQAFDRSRLAKTGEKAGPFERAQSELVLLAEHSSPVLAQALTLKDGVVGRLAIDTLTQIGAPAVKDVAAVLTDKHPDARRRAAEALEQLPNAGDSEGAVQEALAACIENDKVWIVRAQIALALGARGGRHAHQGFALGVLARALEDEDDTVAESAAKALGTLGEVRGIPRLVEALGLAAQAGRPALVEALNKSLAQLSGNDEKRDISQWRAWWRAHEERAAAEKRRESSPR